MHDTAAIDDSVREAKMEVSRALTGTHAPALSSATPGPPRGTIGLVRGSGIVALLLAGCRGPTPTPTPTVPAPPAAAVEAEPTSDPTPPKTAGELAWNTLQTPTGTKVEYATVGTPREGGPVLLALPPGPQTREMVEAGLQPWAAGLASDGWFAISPVSPEGLFFTDSADVLPAFIDAAAAKHGFVGEGLSLFGMSNGGLSAFHLAIAQPQRFRSLVTMPGRPPDDDLAQVRALASMPVTMVVGADDSPFWITGATQTRDVLQQAGARVTLTLLPDTGHAAHLDYDWSELRALLEG